MAAAHPPVTATPGRCPIIETVGDEQSLPVPPGAPEPRAASVAAALLTPPSILRPLLKIANSASVALAEFYEYDAGQHRPIGCWFAARKLAIAWCSRR